MTIVFLVIIFFIIIIMLSIVKDVNNPQTKIEENNKYDKPYLKKIDVPNPNVADPIKFLDFINDNPVDTLLQISDQLEDINPIENIVLEKALKEKISNGILDYSRYKKILEKIVKGNFDVSDIQIEPFYKFYKIIKLAGAHIKERKENIIFNIEEGAEVKLKKEPFNPYDENAIAVFKDNKNIGYIPKNINVQIANCLEKKHRVFVGDIIYNYGFIDVLLYFYISEEKNNPDIYLDKNTILDLQSRKIDSKYLKPKSDAVKKNLFYRKKIVITGEFSFFPDRNELAELLFDSGADIDVGISKNIDYVIVGKSPGWKKIEKINELGIKTFNEEEIKNIFSL